MKKAEFEEKIKKIADDFSPRVQYGESRNNFLATVTGTLFISTFTFVTTDGVFKKIMDHLETKIMWISCFTIGIIVFLIFALSCVPKKTGKHGVSNWMNWRFAKKNASLRPTSHQWWLQKFAIVKTNVEVFFVIKVDKNLEDQIKKIASDSYIIHRKYFFSRVISLSFMIFAITYLIQMILIIFIF